MSESFWYLTGEDGPESNAERPNLSGASTDSLFTSEPFQESMRGNRSRPQRAPSTDQKRVRRQIHRSGELEDKEAAYGEGAQMPIIPTHKLPSIPEDHARPKSFLDELLEQVHRDAGMPPGYRPPGGFDEPFQRDRFDIRQHHQRERQKAQQKPYEEKTPTERGVELLGDMIGPPDTVRQDRDAFNPQEPRDQRKMRWFKQRWDQTFEPLGYSQEGRDRSRRNTRKRWEKTMGPLACDHPNCPPWEHHDDGYRPKYSSKTAAAGDHPFWSQVADDFGCPQCGERTGVSFHGSPSSAYCENCNVRFDARKGVAQHRREQGAFDSVRPNEAFTPLRQSRNALDPRQATVLNTQVERLNKGDQIRTPTGQSSEVKRIRPHETDSTLMYLDTDMGTSTVKRGTDFQVVPRNSQQQELPDTGNPMGGNSAQLPGAGKTPGGAGSSSASPPGNCPNCGNAGTLHIQGTNYICSVCGFTVPAGGSPGNLLFTNQPSGQMPARRKPGEVPRAHVWASKYSTFDKGSQIARRARQVSGGDQ